MQIHHVVKTISTERTNFINELLHLTGDEIYNKYGFKRDETITETVDFGNGIEMDIKLVICDGEEKPYTEAVLFRDGYELACTEPDDVFVDTWSIEYETNDSKDKYVVEIKVEQS